MPWFSRKKRKVIQRYLKKGGRTLYRGGKWVGRRTPYGRAYTAASWAYRAGKAGYRRYGKRSSYSKTVGRRHKAYRERRDHIWEDAQNKYKSRRKSSSSHSRKRRSYGRRRGNRSRYYYYRSRR